MLRIALVYGGIAGGVIIASMIAGFALTGEGAAHGSQLVGYLIMIVALSVIFIAVKRYRDRELGGVIKFGKAFMLGLAIAGLAGVAYVAAWEVYLAVSGDDFIVSYAQGVIDAKKAAGLAGAELDKLIADMGRLVENYANPLFRLPMTFLEIFPVGLLIALISAALLRNPALLPARG